MQREVGTPTDCPNCKGAKKLNRKRCPVCSGEGRVEYQIEDGFMRAPAGSWMPANKRGRTGYMVVLFGGPKQTQTR